MTNKMSEEQVQRYLRHLLENDGVLVVAHEDAHVPDLEALVKRQLLTREGQVANLKARGYAITDAGREEYRQLCGALGNAAAEASEMEAAQAIKWQRQAYIEDPELALEDGQGGFTVVGKVEALTPEAQSYIYALRATLYDTLIELEALKS